MADQALFLRTLSQFAQTLVRSYEVGDVLYELVESVSAVLDVPGAGVSLGEGGRVRFVTGMNEASVVTEEAQERGQDGPCVEAYRTGQVVIVEDLARAEGRWEQLRSTAMEAGFRAVAAIPMKIGDDCLGALNLYASAVRVWSEEDLAVAQVLADIATSYIINASERATMQRRADQLAQALESRVVIEQAKGMLAAERKVRPDDAFGLIRHHARNHNASVRSVAEAIVNLGLRPE